MYALVTEVIGSNYIEVYSLYNLVNIKLLKKLWNKTEANKKGVNYSKK